MLTKECEISISYGKCLHQFNPTGHWKGLAVQQGYVMGLWNFSVGDGYINISNQDGGKIHGAFD